VCSSPKPNPKFIPILSIIDSDRSIKAIVEKRKFASIEASNFDDLAGRQRSTLTGMSAVLHVNVFVFL
jgi:hypothetical protein